MKMNKRIILSRIKIYRELRAKRQIDLDFTSNSWLRDSLKEELEIISEDLVKYENRYLDLKIEELERMHSEKDSIKASIEAKSTYDLDLEGDLKYISFMIKEEEKELKRLGFIIQ